MAFQGVTVPFALPELLDDMPIMIFKKQKIMNWPYSYFLDMFAWFSRSHLRQETEAAKWKKYNRLSDSDYILVDSYRSQKNCQRPALNND